MGLQVHGFQVRFVRQIFRQTQNQLERIVHVMRDACSERADSSKFLCMEQFGLQCRFMLHEYPEKPCSLAIDYVGPRRHLLPKHRLHRWITGDVYHKVEPLVRDQVGHPVIDWHVELLGACEPGSRGILIGDADDLNPADLVEHIEQGHAPTPRPNDGHSHRRRGGSWFDSLIVGLRWDMVGEMIVMLAPCYAVACSLRDEPIHAAPWRATEAFSFSPSTGFTR